MGELQQPSKVMVRLKENYQFVYAITLQLFTDSLRLRLRVNEHKKLSPLVAIVALDDDNKTCFAQRSACVAESAPREWAQLASFGISSCAH